MAIQIDGDSGISGVNGSATTPALQGTDSNTGIVFGTDTVQVATGGSTRATVDSSGRLLVGLSSARANFYNSTNSPYIQLEGNNNNESALAIIQDFDAATQGAQLVLAKNNSQTIGSNVLIDSGDQCGTVSFQGNDGTQFVEAASIIGTIDGTPGANDMPGRLSFLTTADGASSPTERRRLTSAGALCINNTAPAFGEVLRVQNGGSSENCAFFNFTTSDDRANIIVKSAGASGGTSRSQITFLNSSGGNVGSIKSNGSSTSYNTSSDYRLKENVVDLDGAITRVKQLAPKRFNFIADAETTVDGFLAHEAQAVVPEAVTGAHNEVDDDGNPVYQGIDQSKLVPLLTAALQEAIGKIETLETQNADLLARVTALEAA